MATNNHCITVSAWYPRHMEILHCILTVWMAEKRIQALWWEWRVREFGDYNLIRARKSLSNPLKGMKRCGVLWQTAGSQTVRQVCSSDTGMKGQLYKHHRSQTTAKATVWGGDTLFWSLFHHSQGEKYGKPHIAGCWHILLLNQCFLESKNTYNDFSICLTVCQRTTLY